MTPGEPPRTGPRVVVVEDDPVNATLFRTVLEKRAGYLVSLTEDPAELFAWAHQGTIDLIIMDVSLAHSRWNGAPVSGVDLSRMIKSDPRTASIPILLATAHAMRGDAVKMLEESGADGYVAKPILDHAGFVLQVQNLLRDAA